MGKKREHSRESTPQKQDQIPSEKKASPSPKTTPSKQESCSRESTPVLQKKDSLDSKKSQSEGKAVPKKRGRSRESTPLEFDEPPVDTKKSPVVEKTVTKKGSRSTESTPQKQDQNYFDSKRSQPASRKRSPASRSTTKRKDSTGNSVSQENIALQDSSEAQTDLSKEISKTENPAKILPHRRCNSTDSRQSPPKKMSKKMGEEIRESSPFAQDSTVSKKILANRMPRKKDETSKDLVSVGKKILSKPSLLNRPGITSKVSSMQLHSAKKKTNCLSKKKTKNSAGEDLDSCTLSASSAVVKGVQSGKDGKRRQKDRNVNEKMALNNDVDMLVTKPKMQDMTSRTTAKRGGSRSQSSKRLLANRADNFAIVDDVGVTEEGSLDKEKNKKSGQNDIAEELIAAVAKNLSKTMGTKKGKFSPEGVREPGRKISANKKLKGKRNKKEKILEETSKKSSSAVTTQGSESMQMNQADVDKKFVTPGKVKEVRGKSKITPVISIDGETHLVCPVCQEELMSESDLTAHIRQTHNTPSTASKASSRACLVCGKVLSSQSSLDRHVLVHSGERPHRCHLCEQGFTTRGNLKRHLKTHQDAPDPPLLPQTDKPGRDNEFSKKTTPKPKLSSKKKESSTLTKKRKAVNLIQQVNKEQSVGGASNQEELGGMEANPVVLSEIESYCKTSAQEKTKTATKKSKILGQLNTSAIRKPKNLIKTLDKNRPNISKKKKKLNALGKIKKISTPFHKVDGKPKATKTRTAAKATSVRVPPSSKINQAVKSKNISKKQSTSDSDNKKRTSPRSQKVKLEQDDDSTIVTNSETSSVAEEGTSASDQGSSVSAYLKAVMPLRKSPRIPKYTSFTEFAFFPKPRRVGVTRKEREEKAPKQVKKVLVTAEVRGAATVTTLKKVKRLSTASPTLLKKALTTTNEVKSAKMTRAKSAREVTPMEESQESSTPSKLSDADVDDSSRGSTSSSLKRGSSFEREVQSGKKRRVSFEGVILPQIKRYGILEGSVPLVSPSKRQLERLASALSESEAKRRLEMDMGQKQIPNNILHCGVCRKIFLSTFGLLTHLESHPNYAIRCKTCNLVFMNPRGLTMHKRMVHNKSKMGLEEFGAHGIKPADIPVGFFDLSFAEFSTQKFPLVAKAWCEEHQRVSSSAFHNFTCNVCQKSFPCASSFELHNQTHTEITRSKCTQCGTDVETHVALLIHELKHKDVTCVNTAGAIADNNSANAEKNSANNPVNTDNGPNIDIEDGTSLNADDVHLDTTRDDIGTVIRNVNIDSKNVPFETGAENSIPGSDRNDGDSSVTESQMFDTTTEADVASDGEGMNKDIQSENLKTSTTDSESVEALEDGDTQESLIISQSRENTVERSSDSNDDQTSRDNNENKGFPKVRDKMSLDITVCENEDDTQKLNITNSDNSKKEQEVVSLENENDNKSVSSGVDLSGHGQDPSSGEDMDRNENSDLISAQQEDTSTENVYKECFMATLELNSSSLEYDRVEVDKMTYHTRRPDFGISCYYQLLDTLDMADIKAMEVELSGLPRDHSRGNGKVDIVDTSEESQDSYDFAEVQDVIRTAVTATAGLPRLSPSPAPLDPPRSPPPEMPTLRPMSPVPPPRLTPAPPQLNPVPEDELDTPAPLDSLIPPTLADSSAPNSPPTSPSPPSVSTSPFPPNVPSPSDSSSTAPPTVTPIAPPTATPTPPSPPMNTDAIVMPVLVRLNNPFLGGQLVRMRLPCGQCSAVMDSPKELEYHVTKSHEGATPYKCKICSYSSIDKSTLMRHLRSHSGERPYQCLICELAFTTKANCERHIRNKHRIESKRDVEHKIGYNQEMAQKAAMSDAFHSPDTICKTCGVDFKFFRDLNNHLRTSSCAQKPFLCSLCNSGFSNKANCLRHLQNVHVDLRGEIDFDKYVICTGVMAKKSMEEAGKDKLSLKGGNLPPPPPLKPMPGLMPTLSSFPQLWMYSPFDQSATSNWMLAPSGGSNADTEQGGDGEGDGAQLQDRYSTSLENSQVFPSEQAGNNTCGGDQEKNNQELVSSWKQRDEDIIQGGRCYGENLQDVSLSDSSSGYVNVKSNLGTVWSALKNIDQSMTRKRSRKAVMPRKRLFVAKTVQKEPESESESENDIELTIYSEEEGSSRERPEKIPRTCMDVEDKEITKSEEGSATEITQSSAENIKDEPNSECVIAPSSSSPKHDAAATNLKASPQKSKDSSKPYTCSYCNRVFPWTSSLQRHLYSHTGQKPFACPKCDMSFSTKSNRERHLLRKHGMNSSDPAVRQNYDRPYKCHLCVFSTFSTIDKMKKHFKEKHPDSHLPDVHQLGAISKQDNKAENEDRKEMEGDLLPVEQVENFHQSELSLCSDLGQTSQSGDSTLGSLEDQAFMCSKCPNVFESRVLLAKHIREKHTDHPFRCYLHQCDLSYESRQECLEHIHSSHPNEWESLSKRNKLHDIGDFVGELEGAEASAVPSVEKERNSGVRGEGGGSDELARKVSCSLCLKKFWSIQDLRRHMRSHTGEKPFACNYCGRRFSLKHSMMRHRKTHQIEEDQNEEQGGQAAETADQPCSYAENQSDCSDSGGDESMDDNSVLLQNLLGVEQTAIEQLLTSADDAAKMLGVNNGKN